MDGLDSKFERLYETLGDMKSDLTAIKVDLNYHIHRTNLLEQQIRNIDKDVNKLRGFFTIAGWLLAITATLVTIISKIKGL